MIFLPLVFFRQKLVHLCDKCACVLKLSVNGSKAHIGNLIDSAKPLHNLFADFRAGNLAAQRVLKLGFDSVNKLFELLCFNRPLLAGARYADKQLFAVELLARFVLFYNNQRQTFNLFICCEAFSHSIHSRRRLIAFPSSAGRESITLLSE